MAFLLIQVFTLCLVYALDNVKYLMLHTDMPTALQDFHINDSIVKSKFWRELKQIDKLTVYENLVGSSDIRAATADNMVAVNGGYRVITRLYNELPQTNSSNTEFVFVDQKILISRLKKIKYLLSDKPISQSIYDYMYADISENVSKSINKPASATTDYAPETKWSTATLASSHQQEWQPYINKMSDYAWDFDDGNGFLMTSHAGSTIDQKSSNHSASAVVLVRYLANDAGGELLLSLERTNSQ